MNIIERFLCKIVKKTIQICAILQLLVNRYIVPCYFYLVIAGNFAGLYEVTSRVHSKNNKPVQTTQGDDENETGNVHPHGPVKQTH